jgi:DNA-3-methyladenine glycosylase II
VIKLANCKKSNTTLTLRILSQSIRHPVCVIVLQMPVTRSTSGSTKSLGNSQAEGSQKTYRRTFTSTRNRKNILSTGPSLTSEGNEKSTHWQACEDAPALLPAVLSFSFDQAKQHLINVDGRFKDVFDKMQCRPFQQLQRIHPFR